MKFSYVKNKYTDKRLGIMQILNKSNLYLFQFSFLYGNEIYLPYSVGTLWSYSRTIPEIEKNITKKGFRVLGEEPQKIVDGLENPQIAAFSTYSTIPTFDACVLCDVPKASFI